MSYHSYLIAMLIYELCNFYLFVSFRKLHHVDLMQSSLLLVGPVE